MSRNPLAMLLLALAVVAEMAAWAAIGYSTYQLAGRGAVGAVAAITAEMAAIGAWALWAAPKADAPRALAVATKVVVFGAAAALLVAIGHVGWAIALIVIALLGHVGAYLTRDKAYDASGVSDATEAEPLVERDGSAVVALDPQPDATIERARREGGVH